MSSTNSEWHKSSYSQQNGACLETRVSEARVNVRDSKAPDHDRLTIRADAWHGFLTRVTATV